MAIAASCFIAATDAAAVTREVPTFVAHGADGQIVPYDDPGPLAVKLLKDGWLALVCDKPFGRPEFNA